MSLGHINLAGEQAEAAGRLLITDHDWFCRNDAPVCFRRQLPGEWSAYELNGSSPEYLGPAAPDYVTDGVQEWTLIGWDEQLPPAGFIEQECTWVAVVDVARAIAFIESKGWDGAPASGVRVRLACCPVLTDDDRNAATIVACVYASLVAKEQPGGVLSAPGEDAGAIRVMNSTPETLLADRARDGV